MLIFEYLELVERFFWTYIGFIIICLSGLYLTLYSRAFQFKALWNIRKNIKNLLQESNNDKRAGINPFKLYFASVGGMVGIGNIVGVGIAVFIGGPGSIFWMWVASFCGMLIKYCEIYLGVKYRVPNAHGGYDGGPMFYLQRAFSGTLGKFLAYFSAFLLCIYSIEIYQFAIVTETLQSAFLVDKAYIVGGLLVMVLYVGLGGINRLANICSVMMPILMIVYILICIFIIIVNIKLLPGILFQIIHSAFFEQAAVGGFVGSTVLLCGYQGTSHAVYAGDIGIGYDSVIQSETKIVNPRKQAELSIYALFSDTLICSMTTLVIAITGAWHNLTGVPQTQVMAEILKNYIPFSEIFMTIVLFLAGYTTITAYFTAGIKSTNFLSKKYGSKIFFICSSFAFIFFTYFTPDKAKTVMMIAGGMLVLINISAIIKLRHKIDFDNYE